MAKLRLLIDLLLDVDEPPDRIGVIGFSIVAAFLPFLATELTTVAPVIFDPALQKARRPSQPAFPKSPHGVANN